MISNYREFKKEKAQGFFEKGFEKRYFFPHKTVYIPKCGPDALKLANRMIGESSSSQQWEVILHSDESLISDFPQSLFFDDDIIWHKQQFGMTGHVAFAYLVVKEYKLYGLNYVSDLVQRISRKREHKTQIEKRFKGWSIMLLNSILNFAVEMNLDKLYSPTAELAIKNTDPNRTVQRELFDRIYDRAVIKYYKVEKEGDWWVIDIKANTHNIIEPEKKEIHRKEEKTICLIHDTEKGLGHVSIDDAFSQKADRDSPKHTDLMLEIENNTGIKATYNIVGCLLDGYRKKVESGGHCVAFHSFNHTTEHKQLDRCRNVDYRIKGYRTPMSIITKELSDENLTYYNFEWFASSASSFGFFSPVFKNRLVKIPVHFDDFDLYKNGIKFSEWEKMAINNIMEQNFVAFGLHDCYGSYWLPYYRDFLNKIKDLGKFKTMDEVACHIYLSCAA